MIYNNMIKKLGKGLKSLVPVCVLTIAPLAASAQNNDDEITIIDPNGQQEVFEVPEALTNEVDSLLKLYHSQMYLTPDGDCQYRDENPYFSDEVYKERLQRMPNIMEMPYNEVVRKFIDRYASRMRRAVGYWLGASNFYMPIFEQALETYNMPLELRYLPVIESGLNPKATSRVGAAGLWQFMLVTGKQYGLTVNSLVDERRDPIKSSYAAAHFLSDLYKIFGDWNLVIAAYNCGPENINRAIHRAGGERDYWKIYPYLPKETRGYVPAFIAANYIMNYYCEHNICPMRTQLPAKSDTVVVNRDVHLKQVAAVCQLSLEELRTLNPQYRRDIVNGSSGPSIIRLPEMAVNTFIDYEDSIYNYNTETLLTKRSEVAVEEAKPEVMRYTPTTYTAPRQMSRHERRALAASNKSSRHDRKVSREERRSKHKADREDRHSKKGKRGKGKREVSQSVTIKEGQTLSEIARKNHTTVDKLKKLNGIKGSNIRAGKKLKVK